MIKKNQKLLNFLNVCIDLVLIVAAFLVAFSFRFNVLEGHNSMATERYGLLICTYVPVQLFIFYCFRLYEPQRKNRLYKELYNMVGATSICFMMMFSLIYITKDVDFSRLGLLFFYILETVLLGIKRIVLRLMLRYMRSKGFNQKHVIIVGNNPMAHNCYKQIAKSKELGYQVHGYVADNGDWEKIPYLGKIENLEKVLEKHRPDEMIVTLDGDEQKMLDWIVYVCERNGVRFSFVPYFSHFMTECTQIDSLNGIPILNLRRIPLDFFGNAFIKRAMDIVGSLCLIIVTSPIMLAVAIGVKLSSPGPIIFRQERVGRGRRPFYMYKFRSMRVGNDADTGWTTNNDPRKTKFGTFIRKYSLDELPQFFNVLKGEMSLVGPRPEIPFFVDQFKEQIPLYMIRQQIRPGITGWAQVNGLRGDTSIVERARYDRWYIKNWTLGLDIMILFRTVFGGFKNSEGAPEKKKETVGEK